MDALERADDSVDNQQQLLMTAWQALASYIASDDVENQEGAVIALKMVSNLMAGGDGTGPFPTGTFGVTQQTADMEYTCPQCTRDFASEQGLISHLQKIHSDREHTPYKKTGSGPIETQD